CSARPWLSSARSARSVSACDCTETYSPAAMENAPATVPAMPLARITIPEAPVAATPTTSPAIETTPSLAPRTAARSQPARLLRWCSGGGMGVDSLGRLRRWWRRCNPVAWPDARVSRDIVAASAPDRDRRPCNLRRRDRHVSSPSTAPDAPIRSRDELVAYLADGCKPPADWRIGTEHEKFGFRLD